EHRVCSPTHLQELLEPCGLPGRRRRGDLHVSAPSRGSILSYQPTQRAHIRDQLPDLVVGNLAAKRRHAVGTALQDDREDRGRRTAMDPFPIHQGWPNTTTAMRMAADAAEPRKETLALCNGIGIGVIVTLFGGPRHHPELALLALTRRQQDHQGNGAQTNKT